MVEGEAVGQREDRDLGTDIKDDRPPIMHTDHTAMNTANLQLPGRTGNVFASSLQTDFEPRVVPIEHFSRILLPVAECRTGSVFFCAGGQEKHSSSQKSDCMRGKWGEELEARKLDCSNRFERQTNCKF